MKIALVHEHYDEAHLEAVKNEMLVLGAPVIKAVWMECYNRFQALEGCHRIRAAKELRLTPVIEEVEYSEETRMSDIGCECEEDYAVSEICGDNKNFEIEFEE